MLSSLIFKSPINNNTNIKKYCMDSTQKSVQKIIENNNLEKTKLIIVNPLDKKRNIEYSFICKGIIVFLSLTLCSLTFYKRLR